MNIPIGKKSSFKQKMEQKRMAELEVMGDDDGSGVMRRIEEAKNVANVSKSFTPDVPHIGFPSAVHRSVKSFGRKPIEKKNPIHNLMAENVLGGTEFTDNDGKIRDMSASEISEEVSKLKEALGADHLKFLLKRGLQKRGLDASELPEHLKHLEVLPEKEDKEKKVSIEMSGSSIQFSTEDAERLRWTEPLQPEETKSVLPIKILKKSSEISNKTAGGDLIKDFLKEMGVKATNNRDSTEDDTVGVITLEKLRFDFDGHLLSKLHPYTRAKDEGSVNINQLEVEARLELEEKQHKDDLFFNRGLHHHGEDPELPGYSINECLELAQSSNSSQSSVALRILSRTIVRGLTELHPRSKANFGLEVKEDDLLPRTCWGLGRGRLVRFLMGPMNIGWKVRALLDSNKENVVRGGLEILVALLTPQIGRILLFNEESCSPFSMMETLDELLGVGGHHSQRKELQKKPKKEPSSSASAATEEEQEEKLRKTKGEFLETDSLPLHDENANFGFEESAPSVSTCLLLSPSKFQPLKVQTPIQIDLKGSVNDGLQLEHSILSMSHWELDDAKLISVDLVAGLVLRASILDRIAAILNLMIEDIEEKLKTNNAQLKGAGLQISILPEVALCLVSLAGMSRRSKEIAQLIGGGHPALFDAIVALSEILIKLTTIEGDKNFSRPSVSSTCFAFLFSLSAICRYGGQAISRRFTSLSSIIALARITISKVMPGDPAAIKIKYQPLLSQSSSDQNTQFKYTELLPLWNDFVGAQSASTLMRIWTYQGVWAEDVCMYSVSFNTLIETLKNCQIQDEQDQKTTCFINKSYVLAFLKAWIRMASEVVGRALDGVSVSACLPGVSSLLKSVLQQPRSQNSVGVATVCVSFLSSCLQRMNEDLRASVEDMNEFGAIVNAHVETFTAVLDGSLERAAVASRVILHQVRELINLCTLEEDGERAMLSSFNGAALTRCLGVETGGIDLGVFGGDCGVVYAPSLTSQSNNWCVETIALIARFLTCMRRLKNLDFQRERMNLGQSLVDLVNQTDQNFEVLNEKKIQRLLIPQIMKVCKETDQYLQRVADSGEYARPYSGVETMGGKKVHLESNFVTLSSLPIVTLVGEICLMNGVTDSVRSDLGLHALLVSPTVFAMKAAAREALPTMGETSIDFAIDSCLIPTNADASGDETSRDAVAWRGFCGGLLSLLTPIDEDGVLMDLNVAEVCNALRLFVEKRLLHPYAVICALGGSLSVIANCAGDDSPYGASLVPAKESKAVMLLLASIFNHDVLKTKDHPDHLLWAEDLSESARTCLQTFQEVSYLDKTLASILISFASPMMPGKVREVILKLEKNGAVWTLLKKSLPEQLFQLEKELDE
eukprot:GDKJ01025910.1.p1 GENE.GDKJ01025910.1~~GDKJ01025910.1.p1  ORF type:complete len:1391 (+),score=340.33 GDKJ01025910.1:109-4173(+)